jgi:murein DD-endopeptidase MepM/ murein hydrolase activator NlpD
MISKDLASFLAAIRHTESGNFDGNYRQRTGGAVGAYQFIEAQWQVMAEMAGIGGSPIGDAHAQDLTATYWANRWHQRYGDWGLVAAAWIGGQDSADRIAIRGFENTSVIKNPQIAQYVDSVIAAQEQAVKQGYTSLVPGAERMIVEYTGPEGRWIHPVAGKAEYSNSFRVPRQNKSGIHGAIDVYAKKGTPIVSPVAGNVTSVREGGKGGYTVTIMGDDGHKYYFAHMESPSRVSRGERINAGTNVGFVGNSGNASGTSPHLHMSMRDGKNRIVNPFNYLKGSVEGGGAFRPVNSKTVAVNERASFGDMTRGAMEMTGNRIAGGTRVDPRTLGVVEEVEEEAIKPGIFERLTGGQRGGPSVRTGPDGWDE